jgi:hypothetical protein
MQKQFYICLIDCPKNNTLHIVDLLILVSFLADSGSQLLLVPCCSLTVTSLYAYKPCNNSFI